LLNERAKKMDVYNVVEKKCFETNQVKVIFAEAQKIKRSTDFGSHEFEITPKTGNGLDISVETLAGMLKIVDALSFDIVDIEQSVPSLRSYLFKMRFELCDLLSHDDYAHYDHIRFVQPGDYFKRYFFILKNGNIVTRDSKLFLEKYSIPNSADPMQRAMTVKFNHIADRNASAFLAIYRLAERGKQFSSRDVFHALDADHVYDFDKSKKHFEQAVFESKLSKCISNI
jgi:hypothetical protein